jgi:ribose transport system substrate-binding protein
MKRLLCGTALAVLFGAGLVSAHADTSGKRIALSNNYAGNSWRQAMLQSWSEAAKTAIAGKQLAAADSFTTPDKEVTTQAAQVQNLILQGYDAILTRCAERRRQGRVRRPYRRRLLRRHRDRALRLPHRHRL